MSYSRTPTLLLSTARRIIPIATASAAVTFVPSIMSAVARAMPIVRGRKNVPPVSGTSPIFVKD